MSTPSFIVPSKVAAGILDVHKRIGGYGGFEGDIVIGQSFDSTFFFLQSGDHIKITANEDRGVKEQRGESKNLHANGLH